MEKLAHAILAKRNIDEDETETMDELSMLKLPPLEFRLLQNQIIAMREELGDTLAEIVQVKKERIRLRNLEAELDEKANALKHNIQEKERPRTEDQ